MNRDRVILIIFTCMALAACGRYVRVDERQVGDSDINCADIKKQLQDISQIEDQANASVSGGKQFWRIVGFFPAAIKAQSNANNTRRDVKQRREQLFALSDKKGCNL